MLFLGVLIGLALVFILFGIHHNNENRQWLVPLVLFGTLALTAYISQPWFTIKVTASQSTD